MLIAVQGLIELQVEDFEIARSARLLPPTVWYYRPAKTDPLRVWLTRGRAFIADF
jgi:hypothetical protein